MVGFLTRVVLGLIVGAVVLVTTWDAGATWSGYTPICAQCATPREACDSWVGFYTSGGGLPDAVLRSMSTLATDHAGNSARVQCRIARTPSHPENTDIFVWTDADCVSGQNENHAAPSGCILTILYSKVSGENPCDSGQVEPGNPVNAATGNKFEIVTDFTTGGANALEFTRTYNSLTTNTASTLGFGWRHTYDTRLLRAASNPATVYVLRADGKRWQFNRVGGSATFVYTPAQSDIMATLTRTSTSAPWTFTDIDDTKYVFTADGTQLTSITRRNGYAITTTYSGGNLTAVTDSYGRSLTFTYGSGGQVLTMTVPSGRVTTYTYDQPVGWDGAMEAAVRLASVTYPDATPANPSDNPKVQYLHENATYPFALTGITDENGDRYATYGYDANLKATLTEHAGGAGRHTLAYNANGTTTVTNPLGKQAILTFATVKTVPKVTQIAGQASLNCPASNASFAYDANGFMSSATDWNGHQTTWVKNTRGLPTTTNEAVGTSVARTTTTTWHASFRVPTQIVVPGKTTTFTYDSSGRMLTRTETDTTSHTVPYTTAGRMRTWTNTYDSTGRVLTIDWPRTDVADVTTYGYTGADLTS
ncbi:MAG: DUF6531 domain-containing protein [Alphaproteobacteria bacterium]